HCGQTTAGQPSKSGGAGLLAYLDTNPGNKNVLKRNEKDIVITRAFMQDDKVYCTDNNDSSLFTAFHSVSFFICRCRSS
ncbi:MAG: hypothetical protein J6Y88_04170, partial [Bacteroidales bacterium]|nr:hypothetical protein [Bacteroidales bacterium]